MIIDRFRSMGEDEIKLCEHISLMGEIPPKNDSCEYMEEMVIQCKICNETHNIGVLIN